jgi:GcrA cell cycle regulator
MRLGERDAMRTRTPNSRVRTCSPVRPSARCAPASPCARPRSGRDPRGRSMTNPSPVATWNPERVEQLRNFVVAGLTCSQIAAEIGVSRNAVIGKIHRLGLSPRRPAAVPARLCPPRARPPRLPSQRQLLRLQAKTFLTDPTATPTALVDSAQRCSLLELTQGKCRWPISNPGASDFAFCGNDVIAGFSYCAGHARMAYRAPARRSA